MFTGPEFSLPMFLLSVCYGNLIVCLTKVTVYVSSYNDQGAGQTKGWIRLGIIHPCSENLDATVANRVDRKLHTGQGLVMSHTAS